MNFDPTVYLGPDLGSKLRLRIFQLLRVGVSHFKSWMSQLDSAAATSAQVVRILLTYNPYLEVIIL